MLAAPKPAKETAWAMVRIRLFPEISCCVETLARREYEAAAKRLLEGAEPSVELGEKAEVLRRFLEAMDFKLLRRQSEAHLVRGRRVVFEVFVEEDEPRYDMLVFD